MKKSFCLFVLCVPSMAEALKWVRWAVGKERPEDVIADNEKQIALLQTEYDEQARMVEQLTANAVRLSKSGQQASARVALQHKKEAEVAMTQTAGKMATLQAQTNSLRGLDSNVKMLGSIKRGNSVTERVGASLNVNEVDATMAKAVELKDDHREIADMLAGRDYLPIEDPDDLDAELAALTADPANQVYAGQQQPAAAAAVRPTAVGAMAPLPDQATLARQRAEELMKEAEAIERIQKMPMAPTTIPAARAPHNAVAINNVLHYHGQK